MDNCLVCGAYEAIAVARPLLLSRNDASVELFRDFAVFTNNDAQSILVGLRELRDRRDSLLAAAPAARAAFERSWWQQARALQRSAGIAS
jgi:hypothetical protein